MHELDKLNKTTRALPRVVFAVGPTSSGKTALGLRLAHQHNGEIINADSRQIYKGFDIGTGKPRGTREKFEGHRAYMVQGVPHYLMDFLEPTETFTVAEWREKAMTAIRGISGRKHLPIVVGGTGLYIKSLVDNLQFPRIEPQPALRAAFEKKPLSELVKLLLGLDPDAAQAVDLKNPRRVIRALEVATFTGKPFTHQKKVGKPLFDAFQVGLVRPRELLYERIDTAVDHMMDEGWPEEIREAERKGVPENAPAMSSIGYRELQRYIKGEEPLEKALLDTKQAVHRYAKRQETWFRRDKRIKWCKDEDEAVRAVNDWLGVGGFFG
ncbi:tRNA (adenosine(37)-N6)-dimethylallyltransferase MiaA [Candidatus Uhrbacteria bacterium]|nr:tRNA (adenosine(37)-N6)-dimethylallyltransferase MiaA [Candidatus Uhrbacteria bacterium]